MFITVKTNTGHSIDINPLQIVTMRPANEFVRVEFSVGVAIAITPEDRQRILDKGEEILAALAGGTSDSPA